MATPMSEPIFPPTVAIATAAPDTKAVKVPTNRE